MGKLRSIYNQNRKLFWVIILVIIAVYSLILILNSYYKNHPKSKEDNKSKYSQDEKYSVITRETIDEKSSDNSNSLISNFFTFCNSGNIEEAYSLLSSECKEELYPNIEKFKKDYVDVFFDTYKVYNSMLWISDNGRNTYRLEIMEDPLSTGRVSDLPIEEFYTVINENNEYKLNLKRFIGKEDINLQKETDEGVVVTVLNKKIYMNYEIYQVKVENHTGNRIIFNTKVNTESIYIENANDIKYYSQINQLLDSDLNMNAGVSRVLNIQFDKEYNPEVKINKIVFSEINILSKEMLEKVEFEFNN